MTFYLYYELSHKDGKIVYKLSPLGYSEAIKILEKLERMNNERTKDRYDELIMDIGKSFRKQIKG